MPHSNAYSTLVVDGSDSGLSNHRSRSIHENKALADSRIEAFMKGAGTSSISSNKKHHTGSSQQAVVDSYKERMAVTLEEFERLFDGEKKKDS